MLKSIAISLGLLVLVSCGPVTPVVSDFNGASVKLQRSTLVADDEATIKSKMQTEATRICQAGGKPRAEYASTRLIDDYLAEDLYLCLER